MADALEAFGAAILDPALPVPDGIVGPDGRPSPRRFAVYRNNVVAGLIETLMAAYPVVTRLVGIDFFRAMARSYVATNPPTSPIMLDYGVTFPTFVETFPAARKLLWLSDVAGLERIWVEAYHAVDTLPLPPQDLAAVPPERSADLVLTLHPSLRLLRSRYPVVTIWLMNTAGGTPGPVDLDVAEDALVVRPNAEVEVRALPSPAAAVFVGALSKGRSIGAASLDALAADPRFDLSANLAGLLSLGLVTGWRLDEGPRSRKRRAARVLADG